jgi:hypothetical protein
MVNMAVGMVLESDNHGMQDFSVISQSVLWVQKRPLWWGEGRCISTIDTVFRHCTGYPKVPKRELENREKKCKNKGFSLNIIAIFSQN